MGARGRQYWIGRRKKRKRVPKQQADHVASADIERSILSEPTEQELYESDTFFSNCFDFILCDTNEAVEEYIEPSDDADASYIVLDKVYEDFNDSAKIVARYQQLKFDCQNLMVGHGEFSFLSASSYVRYIQCYELEMSPILKTCVTIDHNFSVNISVHGKAIDRSHKIWDRIPHYCFSVEQVKAVLNLVSTYSICPGNPDPQFQNLLPVKPKPGNSSSAGYLDLIGVPSIRGTKCALLIENSRCSSCCLYRRTLTKAIWRQKHRIATPKRDWLKCRMGNKSMTTSQKEAKLTQLRMHAYSLQSENIKLQRKLQKYITDNGVCLTANDSCEMSKIMTESQNTLKTEYPDHNSIQRLFWEQQLKQTKLKNRKGMKWHPMIVKWCIYLKSKSSSTYDALRKTGFINLPSERTLHDYTNVLSKNVGYNDDVICHLQQEVKSFTKKHEQIVGLLQDEIRIKSDLVYNKHTGELVGFVDLDNVGNDINHIEQCLKQEEKTLAKYVLVIMVQGLSTKLRYPLAHFATNGVVSDQLFSILWEAVEILEIDIGLTVLFITSDGASPNRRFIKLHGQGEDTVFRAHNVFANEHRYIYFISDPPHLIKTTRNNFSNSYSHKKSKRLWKNGQDITWMSVVKLYNETCSGMYRLCPKLSRKHVDLRSFNYMKVNLAAQVLSATVANAIEYTYGNQYSETVKFIRHMNKFFDIMNTRNFSEAVRKRNENLKPFSSVEDTRLTYLEEEFLSYFEDWDKEVDERPGNYSKADRNMMKLSYQTIEGLKITVKSVIACIKFCLNNGMPFVLTEKFNQDAIEQHFGIHRASCGSNSNPTLDQFNSSLQKLRIVGSQALAPLRGNTKRSSDLQLDETPLTKKKKLR